MAAGNLAQQDDRTRGTAQPAEDRGRLGIRAVGEQAPHGVVAPFRIAILDRKHHLLVLGQEYGEGLPREAVADQEPDADQIAHLQQEIVVAGVQDAAVEA